MHPPGNPFAAPPAPRAADRTVMQTLLADLATPAIAGLAGVLGIHAAQDILARLRRSGRCPERWR
ncbi:hypothetical protein L083_5278 [Actinoplanes sp. N902-109]|nr:hypothetical protein L083_5278 [Actinoplanes sp. N902-109]